MGYMWRVRLSSFFVGATTASMAGFYLLYKDYMVAHDSISTQVKGISETFGEKYESLNKRITTIEKLKEAENTTKSVEASE